MTIGRGGDGRGAWNTATSELGRLAEDDRLPERTGTAQTIPHILNRGRSSKRANGGCKTRNTSRSVAPHESSPNDRRRHCLHPPLPRAGLQHPPAFSAAIVMTGFQKTLIAPGTERCCCGMAYSEPSLWESRKTVTFLATPSRPCTSPGQKHLSKYLCSSSGARSAFSSVARCQTLTIRERKG